MKNYILLFVLVNISHISIAENANMNKTAILVENTVANDPLKLKQAFAQILANNTGENITDILRNPEFVTANIQSGVKHAYFESIESKYLPENSSRKYWFNLVIHEDFIQGLIKRAGFSVLPHDRENIMVWIVKDEWVDAPTDLDSSPQYQLNYVTDNELTYYWLKQWADALNVVLIFPHIDELDTLTVEPKAIKSLSFDAIEHSKNRYNSNHNLLLYVTHVGEEIKLRSGLHILDNDMWINHYQQGLASEGELLYSMMADVSHNYATQYKVNAQDVESHTVQIVIESLENYDQVVAVDNYLSNLSIVKSHDLTNVSKNELILRVDLLITSSAFLKIVARDDLLLYRDDGAINQLRFTSIK